MKWHGKRNHAAFLSEDGMASRNSIEMPSRLGKSLDRFLAGDKRQFIGQRSSNYNFYYLFLGAKSPCALFCKRLNASGNGLFDIFQSILNAVSL